MKNTLPPFKNGLRVIPYYGGKGAPTKWRIDYRTDGYGSQVGVDAVNGAFPEAVAALNTMTGNRVITVEEVNILAKGWSDFWQATSEEAFANG